MKIKIQGVREATKRFDELQVRDALNKGIKKSIFQLSATAKKETPTGATGFLKNAYRERFSDLQGELVNTKNYAVFVHEGRKAGKMPPIENIALWVARKGISVPPFVIARAIAKKGTKANPFITRTIEQDEQKIPAIIRGEISDLINSSFLN